jgi:predicted  nucleic acid-binding Zn-ribbon protein
MRRCVLLTLCVYFLSVPFARAEFYRWVDREGREFYTNNREQVPQEYKNSAAEVQPDENRVSVGRKTTPADKLSVSQNDHRDKYGKGEEHWHRRAVKLRHDLAALQNKYDILLKRERDDEHKPKKLTATNSGKSMAFRTSQKKIEALERDIARKKHELDVELPDEARKADAYPAWIRE